MFFIFGVSNGEKKLNFNQTMVCPHCGHFGRIEVFVTYMYFSLFFIPIFKWGKRYLVKTTCCNSVSVISNELGKKIEKGEIVEINPNDLQFQYKGSIYKECSNCGFRTNEDFQYCPRCGRVL